MHRISTTTARGRLQAVSAAVLVTLTALTGAAWMTIATPEDGPTVIQLERVVIEGKRSEPRAEVQQLPRVVVVGRRDRTADGAQMASACVAPAVC